MERIVRFYCGRDDAGLYTSLVHEPAMSSDEPRIPIDSPGEYAAGLLKRLGDQEPTDVLDASPATMRALFDGLDDAVIRQPEREGKWSMIDVMHHLADGEMVVGVRIRMILAQDWPPITAYDQDLWADKFRYRQAALREVLAQFTAVREANVRVARQLTAADLERVGIHSERGAESVGYTLRLLAGHDLIHLDQLQRIRRAVA
jgi:hypothetical protein